MALQPTRHLNTEEMAIYNLATETYDKLFDIERETEDDDESFHTETTFMCAIFQLLNEGATTPETKQLMRQWIEGTNNWLEEKTNG